MARPDTGTPRFAGGLTGVMQGEVVVVVATRSLDPPAGTTGGASYSVGRAAAPPTSASATPTLWPATPLFYRF